MGWDGNTENVKFVPRRLKFSISELRRGPCSCHGQAKAHKHAPGLDLRTNQNRNANKILWLFNQSNDFLVKVKAKNQYQDCFWIGELQMSLKVLQWQSRALELLLIISALFRCRSEESVRWKSRKGKQFLNGGEGSGLGGGNGGDGLSQEWLEKWVRKYGNRSEDAPPTKCGRVGLKPGLAKHWRHQLPSPIRALPQPVELGLESAAFDDWLVSTNKMWKKFPQPLGQLFTKIEKSWRVQSWLM